MDKRLSIILVLLILSGLLYVSSNFKEIMEYFSSSASNVASQASETVSVLGEGLTQTGGADVPTELLQSMQNIAQMLNN